MHRCCRQLSRRRDHRGGYRRWSLRPTPGRTRRRPTTDRCGTNGGRWLPHVCSGATATTVKCWGNNGHDQPVRGPLQARPRPVAVTGKSDRDGYRGGRHGHERGGLLGTEHRSRDADGTRGEWHQLNPQRSARGCVPACHRVLCGPAVAWPVNLPGDGWLAPRQGGAREGPSSHHVPVRSERPADQRRLFTSFEVHLHPGFFELLLDEVDGSPFRPRTGGPAWLSAPR